MNFSILKSTPTIPILLVAAVAMAALFGAAGTGCQMIGGRHAEESIGADVQMVELRQVIQTQVKDPQRSKELLEMVKQAEHQIGLVNQNYIETGKQFGKLAADHSKSANDLIRFLNEWEAEVGERRLAVFNLLLAMKTQVTAEEWPAISNAFLNSALDQSDRARSVRRVSES